MAEERMNLAALQQRDPYISEIIDTASQVALYLFNTKTNVWEKLSIAGSLFIYKRSASPENGFMILNRLGLNNLVEPITKYLEFQRQDSFLLYRNIKEQVIYGVWFYEQEECKRFEQQLTRYVQNVMEEEKKKVSPTPNQVPDARKDLLAKGMGTNTQVDIMQMLSKAHQEYNTVTGDIKKKTEPKPMIDNPNASATKKSNLIRPMPLKMPETEQQDDESVNPGIVTPNTAPINLDALFRTASLQQEVSGSQRTRIHRQTSATVTSKSQPDFSSDNNQTGQEGLPPLLKQIMSTGSMVEDIERLHLDKTGNVNTSDPDKICGPVGLPDVTQPPPGHPAYRGPSPREQKSPRSASGSSSHKDVGPQLGDQDKDTVTDDSVPVKFSLSGSSVSPQVMKGNLLPQFFNIPSSQLSQPVNVQNLSKQSKHGDDLTSVGSVESLSKEKFGDNTLDKSEALLTPADLLHSAGTLSTLSSSVSGQQTGPKPLNTSLASAAAASALSTELLSPMAFITARKTPPTGGPEQNMVEEPTKDTVPLPIAPLTKEQLQQAMLYLIKNDSGFISKLHEAYLKSLKELSGHKT